MLPGIICLGQQNNTDTIITLQDSTVKPKTTLTMAAIYGNNTSYYGQKPLEATPYAALAANLRLPSGIYFTGTGYRLLKDSGSLLSAGSFGAGIEFKLSKKLTADISYSHTFYPTGTVFLQAANNNLISGTLTYSYWLSSSVTYDYAFGEQQDMFTSFNTSKSIKLGSLFSSKDGIEIAPAVEVVAGTQRYYKTYVTEKRIRDSIAGIPLLPILGTGTTQTETKTDTETRFNLLSYSVRLPVSYFRASYLIEAAYQLSFLSKKVESAPGSSNSFFTLSFYYQL